MNKKSIPDFFTDFRSENLLRKHRFETAGEQNEALRNIRDKIARVGMDKLGCALSGKPEEECDALLFSLGKEETALLRQIKEPRYNCDACGDTGMVNGGYCNCLLQKLYVQCYGAVDISASPICFDDLDLSLFDDTAPLVGGRTQQEIMEVFLVAAKKHISDIDKYGSAHYKNILLTGKTGLGKSFLLYCMAKEAFERGVDVMLIRAPALFSLFHAHRLGEKVDLSYLHNAKLLMIDDIGAEPVTQNVSNEYFYELVEQRLEKKMYTVFATNIDTKDLQQRYDGRIASRLQSKDNSMIFRLEGRDLRTR